MLHIESIKYVKAEAQANILKNIYDNLTEDEKDIVRRGRNAENHHLPKNSTVEEYRYSTAFEALIGYLYLTKQDQRLEEILKMCFLNIDYFEEKCYINKVQNIGPLVKRLRRSPSKAESWVRFPVGVTSIKLLFINSLFFMKK